MESSRNHLADVEWLHVEEALEGHFDEALEAPTRDVDRRDGRAGPRFAARFHTVWATEGRQQVRRGRTGDLSRDGLRLLVDEPPAHRSMLLLLELSSIDTIPVLAEVVWMRCRPSEDMGVGYTVGLRVRHAPRRWLRLCEALADMQEDSAPAEPSPPPERAPGSAP